MNLNERLISEMQYESSNTRKMLEPVPLESASWKPHEKSMTLGRLATHLAEIPSYLLFICNQPEMDFSTRDFTPRTIASLGELLKEFDSNVEKGVEALRNINDDQLRESWRLRNGEQVFFNLPRIAVVRNMVLSHTIHHRGQLSVYLRLLNVQVPGMYGPSADEMI